jgi:hypothetical protein
MTLAESGLTLACARVGFVTAMSYPQFEEAG